MCLACAQRIQQMHARAHVDRLAHIRSMHPHPHSHTHIGTHVPLQLRLAQVSHELHDRISATPRYEALSELKEHCSIDLSKEWHQSTPAEQLFKIPPRPRWIRSVGLIMPVFKVGNRLFF